MRCRIREAAGYQALDVDQFLLARRLVEAGVRCVTVSFADFDWHGGNFDARPEQVLPLFDQGITALVDDLHDRGLDQRRDRRRLGRVRPHAAHQQRRRPRPLAAGELSPCWPAAA